ncbi:hypothetical protein [Sphingomonas sp. S2-65]|uniref:hypothetical protein n=1 Tax=Sphingomonas sp. S2-65 TaxID=2903960 RepID=UPI001F35D595|nr:hypothetical protein [Sphingomonas sp. S2-65]UYY57089.1 hypothetical protein LZ586_10355 [Sphingomonas sp. S2-65]
MIKSLLAVSTAVAALSFSAPAFAQASALTVSGTVAGYCDVRLANVSSGTATIAFTSDQKIANLQLACNQPGGTRLVVNPANGDLTNSTGRINYAMRLVSPQDSAFTINTTDTSPGDGEGTGLFTRSRAGYSQPIANGVPLELWLNVNVQNENGPDGPDFNGLPLYPANAAPAGTYAETFNFTVTAF